MVESAGYLWTDSSPILEMGLYLEVVPRYQQTFRTNIGQIIVQ